MTLITALEIQTNGDDIRCAAGGPSTENGKYVGWISLWRGGNLHKEMLSTDAIFDTADEAKTYMESVVAKVRDTDLMKQEGEA